MDKTFDENKEACTKWVMIKIPKDMTDEELKYALLKGCGVVWREYNQLIKATSEPIDWAESCREVYDNAMKCVSNTPFVECD